MLDWLALHPIIEGLVFFFGIIFLGILVGILLLITKMLEDIL